MTDHGRVAERFSVLQYGHLREFALLGAIISSQGEDGIISCLYISGREMLSGELVTETGLTTGRVANILNQLEKKQLISRTQDTKDRRCVHVCLTKTGCARAARLFQESVEKNSKLFEYLGEEDSLELVRLVEKCFTYMRKQEN